jgi:hypothetical protein
MRAMSSLSAALLISPRHFGFNAETAASNAMQRPHSAAADTAEAAAEVAARARAEGAALAQALRDAGVTTVVVEDADEVLPDAVFPNNWLSFHEDGTLVVYPLLAPLRRRERREAVIDAACAAARFTVRRRLDLQRHERDGHYLEGTGSLVLDRAQHVAYACRSPRTSETLATEWARELGYTLCCFDATDARGIPYYHTNVMMWIGARCAAVCLEAVALPERAGLRAQIEGSGRTLIELSRTEIAQFCGNMLEFGLHSATGARSLLVMSSSAAAGLRAETAAAIRQYVDAIVTVPVPTIERIGGGSVRCMIAEVPMTAAPPTGSAA